MIDRIRTRLSDYWAGLDETHRVMHIVIGLFIGVVLFGTVASAIAG